MRGVFAPLSVHEVIAIRICGANRCAAVAGNIPREAHTRRQLKPTIVGAFFTGKAWISGVVPSGGRVPEGDAFDALAEAVFRKISDVSVDHALTKKRLPPNAIIHSQSGPGFPGIRGVHCKQVLSKVQFVAPCALDKCVESSQHEVAHPQTGILSIEGHCAGRHKVVLLFQGSIGRASAERHLVRSMYNTDVVADAVSVGMEPGVVGRLAV